MYDKLGERGAEAMAMAEDAMRQRGYVLHICTGGCRSWMTPLAYSWDDFHDCGKGC